MAQIDFILGGIRSGKSAFAEKLALSYGSENHHYLATAEAVDEALEQRIEAHRLRRQGDGWQVHEEALHIDRVLADLQDEKTQDEHNIVLLDSLDMWVNNLLHYGESPASAQERLLSAVQNFSGRLVVVSAEVGLSLLPPNAQAAEFCDVVGELNQALAAMSHRVILVVAGLPYCLKGKL